MKAYRQTIRFSWVLMFLTLAFLPSVSWGSEKPDLETDTWVVSPESALELIDAGEVTILDTRSDDLYSEGHLKGAVQIHWTDFTPTREADRGELLADIGKLGKRLRKLGVSADKPVLVVGNPPDNWGEDGRIVWMLRTLGHKRVALVNGGYRAVIKSGGSSSNTEVKPGSGDFEPQRTDSWSIERESLREYLDQVSGDVVIVDTRSRTEYEGNPKYGEDRPGHIPGAKHLHYTELLDENGRLLPESKIMKRLKKLGITKDKRVISYCTGGVRSAWLTVVLAHLGFDKAQNYPGSAWDWAAANPEAYPLERKETGSSD
jgi:thiosulfate/3-mercaptopyruvate sulfurtransferase